MKSTEKIEENINAAFKALESIEEVKVNHFFKHKVLQQLENQKEEKLPVFVWFTPKLQFTTLAMVLLLNVGSILYAFSAQENKLTIKGNFNYKFRKFCARI